MSVARLALREFTEVACAAIAPNTAYLDDGLATADDAPAAQSNAVAIRPLALERTSRSHRDGPVLDLELTVAVSSSGDQGLENIEALLTAVEAMERYRIAPWERPPDLVGPLRFGFLVRIPVAVRLQIPAAPPVREPLRLHMETGRLLHGVVVGRSSKGLAGVQVRAHSSNRTATSGKDGTFEVLATEDATQHFTVAFNGETRRLAVTSPKQPVTLRWEPADHEREPS